MVVLPGSVLRVLNRTFLSSMLSYVNRCGANLTHFLGFGHGRYGQAGRYSVNRSTFNPAVYTGRKQTRFIYVLSRKSGTGKQRIGRWQI